MLQLWMMIRNPHLLSVVVLLVLGAVQLGPSAFAEGQSVQTGSSQRPVTVSDVIRMTQIGDREYIESYTSDVEVVQFSPDGSHFSFVTQKGNLENNTVEFSLHVFKTSEAFLSPKPETILTFASSSNREAISQAVWLNDNDTIVFLGEREGETPQVFRISVQTKRLEKLTSELAEILSYAIARTGEWLIYTAEPSGKAMTQSQLQNGFAITTEAATDLLAGVCRGRYSCSRKDEIFVKNLHSGTVTRIGTNIILPDNKIHMSPNGVLAVVRAAVTEIPEAWHAYEDKFLQREMNKKRRKDEPSYLFQDLVIDVRQGTMRPLIDAPRHDEETLAWSPDSKSIVLAKAWLPLTITDASEKTRRQSKPAVAEVKLETNEVIKIADLDGVGISAWDADTKRIILDPLPLQKGTHAQYEKVEGTWRKASTFTATKPAGRGFTVVLKQGLNSPPKLVAKNQETHSESVVMDLNPQFEGLSFGHVEAIAWTGKDGTKWTGGLYFPSHYTPGTKYPLVIQNHGFAAERFWIDGAYSTAFAAQPLAGKGFVVLQVGDGEYDDWMQMVETPRET